MKRRLHALALVVLFGCSADARNPQMDRDRIAEIIEDSVDYLDIERHVLSNQTAESLSSTCDTFFIEQVIQIQDYGDEAMRDDISRLAEFWTDIEFDWATSTAVVSDQSDFEDSPAAFLILGDYSIGVSYTTWLEQDSRFQLAGSGRCVE